MKPDFGKAYCEANKILLTSRVISDFPFSCIALAKEQGGIVCRSYSKASLYSLDAGAFGSDSAILVKIGEKSIIFYNDLMSESRKRFSILHEMAHSVLGHILNDNIDDETYSCYEHEANYFAAQLLMAIQLLWELRNRGVSITPDFLRNTFGVSQEAAEKRIKTLDRFDGRFRSERERERDRKIVRKYNSVIAGLCDQFDSVGVGDLASENNMKGGGVYCVR